MKGRVSVGVWVYCCVLRAQLWYKSGCQSAVGWVVMIVLSAGQSWKTREGKELIASDSEPWK